MNGIDNNVSTVQNDYLREYEKSSKRKTHTNKSESRSSDVKNEGVVYKRSDYSINKLSEADRAALVSKLKNEQQEKQSQLTTLVKDIISKQAQNFSITEGDDIWKFLAEGKFTIDEAAKAKAQEAISEDGYYGVSQTAQRIFDFASALAGDDVDSMKKMQEAFEKGYEAAEKLWNNKLPDISQKTRDKVNWMFDDYYKSKEEKETETPITETPKAAE